MFNSGMFDSGMFDFWRPQGRTFDSGAVTFVNTFKSGQRTVIDSPTLSADQRELKSSRCLKISLSVFWLSKLFSLVSDTPRYKDYR